LLGSTQLPWVQRSSLPAASARQDPYAVEFAQGWYKASNGYIYVWEPEHPNADKRGYVAEHTKVMGFNA
jgi:flagellar basal body rod protein FlgC